MSAIVGFNITDTSYAGTVETNYMILNAMYQMDTLQNQCAYVIDGIKKAHNIPTMDLKNPMQSQKATPTTPLYPSHSGTTATVSVVTLTPTSHLAYHEFDPRDFEQHFYAEQLSNTLLARELPMTASNFLMQLFLNRIHECLEQELWMGSTTYGTAHTGTTAIVDGAAGRAQIYYTDGIIKQLLAAGAYTSVNTGGFIAGMTNTGLTDANIELYFNDAYKKVPKAILANPEYSKRLKFLVSYADRLKWYSYTSTSLVYKGNNIFEQPINMYKNIPIVALAGIPENTFLLTVASDEPISNIWVGINSFEDNLMQLSRLQANSELWFLKFLWKQDVKITKKYECVLSTDITSAYFLTGDETAQKV